jgi:hypothetical protein
VNYRLIEILLIILISFIQNAFRKEKIKYKKTSYRRLVIVIDILLLISFGDILFGLIFNFFPFLNFLIRPLVLVLLNTNLRREWIKIFKLIRDTKSISFILFFMLFVFSLIGHLILAQDDNEFKTFFTSLDSMFILLITNNFPDILLKALEISKLSIVFFVSYLLINYFIFLSLLKALYYASYIDYNISKAKHFIKTIRSNKVMIDNKEDLTRFLVSLNKKFSFSKEEYDRIRELVQLAETNLDYQILLNKTKTSQNDDDSEKMKIYPLLRIIRMKRFEIILNIINLSVIGFALLNKKNLINDLIQMVVSFYFVIEYLVYINYYSVKKMLRKKILRSMFFFINILITGIISIIILYEIMDWNSDDFIILAKPFIILRSIRLLNLLNLFQEYKIIFTTLNNMKTMFWNIMATQFSFYLIFSTVTMIFLGGKVKKDQYKNSKIIPDYYSYLNFNNFPSAFLTCFSLMMVNNMNIVTEALAQPVGNWLKAYFSLFYFLGILIILHICQTYILDMYISTKKSKKV